MGAKVLITGLAGFVGSHLTEHLLNDLPDPPTVHGIVQPGHQPDSAFIERYPQIGLHRLELEDRAGLTALLKTLEPDFIFHLAARSFIGPSITNPGLTLNTNINISLNLFEAVRASNLTNRTRILNVGSSDQYGFLQPADLPVRETTAFRPGNPYAVSKIAQEMLGYQYFRSYGLHIVNTRAFNHLGPRQSAELAAGAFARQIAQAEAGQIEPLIRVGNLDARRDYLDVRDVVRGYWLALQPAGESGPGCLPGEAYNLCSGIDRSIREILEGLLRLARCELQIQTDPARLRPSDLPIVRGDYTKFHHATGWQPLIPLEQSLRDLLDWWREATI